ncbi:hypothetical protein NDU88_005374 [Pleurodeles waltl]|uniref:Uncharacterized protein n=1 Tax=Pleurodeles waltl TaxID=8319 RepID=A0AAV7L0L0_PLEWA|nr:hypothetical protein NDU88_005374 [Pleurodeles waltl]
MSVGCSDGRKALFVIFIVVVASVDNVNVNCDVEGIKSPVYGADVNCVVTVDAALDGILADAIFLDCIFFDCVGEVKSTINGDLVEINTLVDEMRAVIAATADVLDNNALIDETIVSVDIVVDTNVDYAAVVRVVSCGVLDLDVSGSAKRKWCGSLFFRDGLEGWEEADPVEIMFHFFESLCVVTSRPYYSSLKPLVRGS